MTTYFPDVPNAIPFEGKGSRNSLAYKYYNPDQVVGDRTMAEHLRFAVAYWHSFKATGSDMFGAGTWRRPWNAAADPIRQAEDTLDACFEFCAKLGAEFFCFHDRDLAPEGETFADSCRNLEHMVKCVRERQRDGGPKLLWGTANLFSHPRYANGAATNPDPHVFAYAAAQVKHAIAATHELGGQGYVFWGGREGYQTLLNTDLKREQEQLASMLHMAVDYAARIGFEGQFLIEPKPCEPTKHQYDNDVAAVLGFLERFDLAGTFKVNLEANHATLAGHSFEHELVAASSAGMLGSVDANRGDLLLGWDTDQFPTDIYQTTFAMLVILAQGGLAPGGLNFDAHVRRESVDSVDLFHAHVGAMDAFARGLIIAQEMIDDGVPARFIAERYAGWDTGIGQEILAGETDFERLDQWILATGDPSPVSGRQEMLENLVNDYIQ